MPSRPIGRAALAGLQSGAPAVAGPRLLRDQRLEVERRLPLPGKVETEVGRQVAPDDVIATAANAPSRLHIVELAHEFERQMSPDDVRAALLVKEGDPVSGGTPLARVRRRTWLGREDLEAASPADGVVEFISSGRAQVVIRSSSEVQDERIALQVAGHLGVEPSELPTMVTCRVGQEVAPGDLLAKAPGFRPLGSEFRSPVAGTVESISPLSGTIVVVRPVEPLTLRAFMAGRVVQVLPGYGARITARGHRILGVLGLGGKSWGRLRPLDADGEAPTALVGARPARPEMVKPEHAGEVLAFSGAVDAAVLDRCREVGVRGVIAGSAHARELSAFLGRPLAAEIVTGPGVLSLDRPVTDDPRQSSAPGGPPVVLTEGFGRLPMDALTWELLCEHSGTVVSIDGLTQIRAGVVRPALLIPTGPDEEPWSSRDADGAGPNRHSRATVAGPADIAEDPAVVPPAGPDLIPDPSVRVGQRVRLVRQPHFGSWGTVLEVADGLTRLETEVEARILWVRLDDGRLVQVAEANVEI